MDVEVHCLANLADFLPAAARGRLRVTVPPGATVADLVAQLSIPPAIPRLILVNGQDAGTTRRLAPGDLVTLLPPLAGGAVGRSAGPPG
jgi:sulfur carrier protein ThiS